MNDLERRRKMASQIAGSFDDEPDVTPKTESGPREQLEAAGVSHWAFTIHGNRGVDEMAAGLDRIRQEAASKAVAEVLDRLEAKAQEYSRLTDRDVIKNGPAFARGVRAVAALIASERKP